MLPDEIVNVVNRIVSGIQAKDYAVAISAHHRIQASPGIHDAIEYLQTQIKQISDAKIKVFKYVADGASPVETWDTPLGWSAKSGKLDLLEPEEDVLAMYSAEPLSLIAHSKSTDFKGDVVYVGKGVTDEDYEGKDVKGKLVLTESLARIVHRVAVLEKGAAGVLTFVPPSGKDEIAALRRYDAFWPNKEEVDATGFGFALTQADGIKLKDWLESRKSVRVHAKVDAKLHDGDIELLSALLPGKDASKEVWLFAHVCHPHPGANDNASGSGVVMETLRAISELVKSGELEQPEYSIRFLWGPEWSSTIKFIHHEKELLKKCIAMINLDMVGADPSKSGSILNLYRTPFSLPTTLNNLVRYWMETETRRKDDRSTGGTMAPIRSDYTRYSAGSDHFMLTDGTVGIPAIMLNQYPDRFYHTSTDTVDKLDVKQMGLSSRIAVLSTIALASPKHTCKEQLLTLVRNEAVELMHEISLKGVRELARCIGNPEIVYPRVIRWLRHAFDLGQDTLTRAKEEWVLIAEQESILRALDTSLEMMYSSEMLVARKAYEGACAEVGLQPKDEDQLLFKDVGFEMEVRRTFRHALNPTGFINRIGKEGLKYMKLQAEDIHIFSRIDELLNLAVDWKSLDTIYDLLCFQFGVFEDKLMSQIVRDLSSAGLLDTRGVE
ncbi:MAG: DUF4910 domain-containing protein [Candidatus Thorarchaeota archaeon]